MIGFFPIAYSDELLYSIIARYYAWSANTNPKTLLKELFGSRKSLSAGFDLPNYVSTLIENLPPSSQCSAKEFIYQNTLYPYFSSFISSERSQSIYKAMSGQGQAPIHAMSGISGCKIPIPTFFRFCPTCLNEDITANGEAYWHRVHQINGVYICPVHRVWLRTSSVKISGDSKREFQSADEDKCSSEVSLATCTEENFNKLLILAEDINYVLNNPFAFQDAKWFLNQYRFLLADKGLMSSSSGIIHTKKLINEFINFYDQEFLRLVYSDVNYEKVTPWFVIIARKFNVAYSPVKHLLYMRFLGKSPAEFFKGINCQSKFGKGPWKCFNPAADHYMKEVVVLCSVSYSCYKKRTVGVFTCKCGFIYSTSTSETSHNDEPMSVSTKKFGRIWEEKLTSLLVVKKVSLREASRQLKLNPQTIKRQAMRLNIVASSNEVKVSLPIQRINENRIQEEKRTHWLKIQMENPMLTKSQLCKKFNSISWWLYKHDRNWFDKNSPALKKYKLEKSRIDWTRRDRETYIDFTEAIKLIREKSPPVQVNLPNICRELNQKVLDHKRLAKISNTKRLVTSNTESTQDFQIRRINWAAKELSKKGSYFTKWKVLELAGVRNRTKIMVAVANEVIAEIISMQLSLTKKRGFKKN